MDRRDLQIFLALEIGAIVWAASMFTVLADRLVAGWLAGSYFVVTGLYMLYRAVRWPKHWSSLTWYCLIIHVFAISMPMLLVRVIHRDLPFEDVRIAGLSGPQFHQLSSMVFTGLMVATVVDWLRIWWAARTQPTL